MQAHKSNQKTKITVNSLRYYEQKLNPRPKLQRNVWKQLPLPKLIFLSFYSILAKADNLHVNDNFAFGCLSFMSTENDTQLNVLKGVCSDFQSTSAHFVLYLL